MWPAIRWFKRQHVAEALHHEARPPRRACGQKKMAKSVADFLHTTPCARAMLRPCESPYAGRRPANHRPCAMLPIGAVHAAPPCLGGCHGRSRLRSHRTASARRAARTRFAAAPSVAAGGAHAGGVAGFPGGRSAARRGHAADERAARGHHAARRRRAGAPLPGSAGGGGVRSAGGVSAAGRARAFGGGPSQPGRVRGTTRPFCRRRTSCWRCCPSPLGSATRDRSWTPTPCWACASVSCSTRPGDARRRPCAGSRCRPPVRGPCRKCAWPTFRVACRARSWGWWRMCPPARRRRAATGCRP